MLSLGADNYNLGLNTAATCGNIEIAQQMLVLGAKDIYNTALCHAAFGGYNEIVELMLSVGGNDYNWAIYRANEGGHPETVELLHKHKKLAVKNVTEQVYDDF